MTDIIKRLARRERELWRAHCAEQGLCVPPEWERLSHGVRASHLNLARKFLAAARAEGLTLVPVEATAEMVRAAIDRGTEEPTMYHGIWRAMVAAGRVDGGGE